jgi:hypothetical protein
MAEVHLEVCELHEVSNCSICTGLDKQLQIREQQRTTRATTGRSVRIRLEALPPGGVHAMYPGRCANCGVFFEAGEAIRYSESADGFVSMECCG